MFLGGTIAEDLFGTIGLGETAATVWIYARWLVALAAMMLMFAIDLRVRAGPRAPQVPVDLARRRARRARSGSLASGLFFLYVSNFGNYGATYGAFAGAIILLLWLYITSLAFLLGGELNGEIERAQIAGRGGPPPPSPPPSPRPAGARPPAGATPTTSAARRARGSSRPVMLLGCHEHSARRPGQPAHRPMCGSGATAKRPSWTPAASASSSRSRRSRRRAV